MSWWEESIVTWTTLVVMAASNLTGVDVSKEETVNDAES